MCRRRNVELPEKACGWQTKTYRVIAATNRDLNAAAGDGTFRQDLFYRLNVFPIEVPPLRERKEDLLMLVEYFVQRYANRADKSIQSIDKKTLDLLQSYEWPGNIRELQNVIERSVILSSGEIVSVDELWLSKEISPPDLWLQRRWLSRMRLSRTPRGRLSRRHCPKAEVGFPDHQEPRSSLGCRPLVRTMPFKMGSSYAYLGIVPR